MLAGTLSGLSPVLSGLLNEEPVKIRSWPRRGLGVVLRKDVLLGGRLVQGEHNTFFKVFEESHMDMSVDSSWKVPEARSNGAMEGAFQQQPWPSTQGMGRAAEGLCPRRPGSLPVTGGGGLFPNLWS